MESNKYKKLAINSLVFAIANFGSKVLKFVIVPFYTYFLTTAEYGVVDTLTTTISLLLPIVIFAIHDATLRFAMKKELNEKVVLTNSVMLMLCNSIIFLPIYFVFRMFEMFDGLWWIFYALLIMESLNNIIFNFTRGIGKSFTFAIGGIINTFTFLISNVMLLAVFNCGLRGYLISMLIGYFFSTAYLSICINFKEHFSIKAFDFEILKKMLKYSIPLIPAAMMWWVMNASDRYIIMWKLGVEATGIYAVSYKIPTIITVIYQIFQQAWQISAIEEMDSADSDKFYNNIYSGFIKIMFIVAGVIILVTKPFVIMTISSEYADAWKYVPILVISAIFSSLAGFLGVNYAVTEKTFNALSTSVIGALINIILSIALTPVLGMQGTAIATLVGYYILWIVRAIEAKKTMTMRQYSFVIHIHFALVIIQSIVLISEMPFQYAIQIVIILLMIFINRNDIKFCFKSLKKIKNRRR